VAVKLIAEERPAVVAQPEVRAPLSEAGFVHPEGGVPEVMSLQRVSEVMPLQGVSKVMGLYVVGLHRDLHVDVLDDGLLDHLFDGDGHLDLLDGLERLGDGFVPDEGQLDGELDLVGGVAEVEAGFDDRVRDFVLLLH